MNKSIVTKVLIMSTVLMAGIMFIPTNIHDAKANPCSDMTFGCNWWKCWQQWWKWWTAGGNGGAGGGQGTNIFGGAGGNAGPVEMVELVQQADDSTNSLGCSVTNSFIGEPAITTGGQ